VILRPDIEDRCHHSVTKAYLGPEVCYPAAVTAEADGFSFNPTHSHALILHLPGGKFIRQPEWHYMVYLKEEDQRGLDAHTDLFSPGYFEFELKGGENRSLNAEINCGGPRAVPADPIWRITPVASTLPAEEALRGAMSHFIVRRDDSRTIIAGYPWFLDWGRDTLICLRGLIAAGLLDEAADIIRVFAGFEKNGTLPNMIRGNDDSNRDTSDAPLWLFVAVGDYLRRTGSRELLQSDCRGRSLAQVLASIAEHYQSGTPNGIRADAASGLIFSPSHFTWMDTNHPAGSPREGYPIEIQALWRYALHLLYECSGNERWARLAKQTEDSIRQFYPLATGGLSDCLHGGRNTSASAAVPDDACRPNQLFAVTLGAIPDPGLGRSILAATEELLIPGALRSLADRPVNYPLPVDRHGARLNDPCRPYWGRYEGDEDTRRKPAYHNGTAWTWPFPSYCEALLQLGGETVRNRALALLTSAICNLERGCPGHTPEILDGNAPHLPRGCGAQAWGVTELFRVYRLLVTEPDHQG
ncbi:MAG: amylo-alpha-1,6-glucosidase, partial [Victivallales bacterium]|nr:amylo-alpha-1,6-glucosidase [Victivallales bacterium]